MARGVWPRPVVAVPDVSNLIVRVLHVATDLADLLFVCGGFPQPQPQVHPDDITGDAIAKAFYAACRSTMRWRSGSSRTTRGPTSGPSPQPIQS